MSDDGSSNRARRKTRRVKRRALRVPLDDVPRTSAVAPAPSMVEASVEIELDTPSAREPETIDDVEIDVSASDESNAAEVVPAGHSDAEENRGGAAESDDAPVADDVAAVQRPVATRADTSGAPTVSQGQVAVTMAQAVMISAPPPEAEKPEAEAGIPAAVAVPAQTKAEEPEVTHELELDDADIEPEEAPDLVSEPPAAAAVEDDDAPERSSDEEPEVTFDQELDDDFEDDLEDVGELSGAPTVPGASLAELEAARREALGEVADGVDPATADASESVEALSDHASTDDMPADDEDSDEPALTEVDDDDDDDDVEDIDSGDIEVEPAPASTDAPPPPPTALPEVPVRRRAWFEDFFNDDYLRTVRSPTDAQVGRQCDFIVETLGLAPGATILDVGCGLGLHAIELTNRGFLVVGLDLSLPMLSRASDEAQDRGLKINFLHGDMREMTFEGAFDAVLSWGTSFGYFDDDANRRVANRMRHALKPGGKLLLDVTNRDCVLATQPNLVWFEGDGCVVMEETSINYFSSRLQVKRNVILDDGRQRDTRYSIRLYALHELGQLLHQEGFRVGQVSGMEATRGVFFGAASPRLLVLAERRAAAPANGQTPAVPRPSSPSSPEVKAAPATTPPPAHDTPPPPQNAAPGEPESE